MSQEQRLHGRSITGCIHLGGECVSEGEAKGAHVQVQKAIRAQTAIRSTAILNSRAVVFASARSEVMMEVATAP